ncbi:MAG: nucleotidyltransferase domain-containing protein [Promethearchaeota archaeon]
MSNNRILQTHNRSVIYSNEQWELLELKRNQAISLMSIFEPFQPFLYGSIARGNVHRNSDIDIIFLNEVPSFQIELALEMNGFKNYLREIIIATPQDSIRLYIHLSDLECITVPLTKMAKETLQFYDFGGKINLARLKNHERIPGIDKRLVFIRPTAKGHEEKSIIDNEHIIARELGINIKTINQRKKILLKREKQGRSGVFFKHRIEKDEITEEVLNRLSRRHSLIRKKLYRR